MSGTHQSSSSLSKISEPSQNESHAHTAANREIESRATGTNSPSRDELDETSEQVEGNDEQASLPNSVTGSLLFKLSPELRNLVYRFALVTDDKLKITKAHGTPEHALLSVNKIVRSEAFAIFYLENTFHCVVEHYDPASIVLACRRFHKSSSVPDLSGHKTADYELYVRGPRNWKNLKTWLQLCNRGRCCGLGPDDDDNTEQKLLVALFDIAKHEGRPRMATGGLDALLEAMRPVLVDLHRDWAKD